MSRNFAYFNQKPQNATHKTHYFGKTQPALTLKTFSHSKKELERMVKVYDSLCDTEAYYFQAVQKAPQSLERLVQGEEIQDEEKGETK